MVSRKLAKLFFCVWMQLSYSALGQPTEAIVPIDPVSGLNQNLLALGEKLYNSPVFSNTNTFSCASCHDLKEAGTDHKQRYLTKDNKEGFINTPTTLNAVYNFRQFWDGRAHSLEEAFDDHLLDKSIFNSNWQTAVNMISSVPVLKAAFSELYSVGVTEESIKHALKHYLGYLVTPNAPFDRYLLGDKNALSKEALEGFEIFQKYGCISCHQGKNIGGNLFEKLGVYKDYFFVKRYLTEADLGRYNITGNEEDILVFKVPSLRNVARTGPYFHDGSANTLEDAIQKMAEFQIGQSLTEHEVSSIAKFLETLNGDIPEPISKGPK